MITEIRAQDEAVSRWSKCRRNVYFVFGLLCFVASAVLLLLAFLLFKSCTNCQSSTTELTEGEMIGGVAILLFLIGGLTLILWRKSRPHSSSPQVVISEIPAADLEKSPAPILPYNHIPHHEPFVDASSFSLDLPDYFTIVNNTLPYAPLDVTVLDDGGGGGGGGDDDDDVDNTEEVDPFLNSSWTDVSDTSPPSYKEALEMMASSSEVDTNIKHEPTITINAAEVVSFPETLALRQTSRYYRLSTVTNRN